MVPDFLTRMAEILEKHPRPWHIVDFDLHGAGVAHAWISDSNGGCVVGSSEWLDMDDDLMHLMVDMFNASELPPLPNETATP
jgi:hypothetical protein